MSEYNSWTDQTRARNNIMDISLQMSSRHTKDVKYFTTTVQINNSLNFVFIIRPEGN